MGINNPYAPLMFSNGPKYKYYTLLNGTTQINEGTWQQTEGHTIGTLQLKGLPAGNVTRVEIYGSNEPETPDSSNHEHLIYSFTINTLYPIDITCRWIKARVALYGGGTIYAYAFLR